MSILSEDQPGLPLPKSRLTKKQSLSILSGSSLNKLGNAQNISVEKPLKDRVISESTGLIKFALRKASFKLVEEPNTAEKPATKIKSLGNSNYDPNDSDKQGLPIYIPINCNETSHTLSSDSSTSLDLFDKVTRDDSIEEENEELLFQLASKQRKALELKLELAVVEGELKQLENKYKVIVLQRSNANANANANLNLHQQACVGKRGMALNKRQSILDITSSLSTGKMKIGGMNGTINQTEELSNFSKTFNNFTNNLTNNINNNEFLNKSKNMIENLNKENEKWFSELNNKTLKLKLDKTSSSDSNPMFKKLLSNKLGQNKSAQEQIRLPKLDTDSLKSSFNNIFNRPNNRKPDQLPEDSLINMAESSMINSTEASFEYSDCNYYDDSKLQNSSRRKKKQASPRKQPQISKLPNLEEEPNGNSILNTIDDDELGLSSDEEDYGGEVKPFVHDLRADQIK